MTAYDCAAVIHQDFQKGFIKAEIISYEDYLKYQTENELKKHGKIKIVGKNYVMKDGDICHFRFNV